MFLIILLFDIQYIIVFDFASSSQFALASQSPSSKLCLHHTHLERMFVYAPRVIQIYRMEQEDDDSGV